jgi:prevent-host-death family protein
MSIPKRVNIHQAKTELSRLIEEAASGQRIVIAKAGKPVATLVPVKRRIAKRKPGSAGDELWIAPNFNAPLPKEIIENFEK